VQPFTSHTAIAAPLLKDDINTDQVAPILHSRGLKEDYKAMLFAPGSAKTAAKIRTSSSTSRSSATPEFW
jgi:3-isopropylmalate dehydratase small subunit